MSETTFDKIVGPLLFILIALVICVTVLAMAGCGTCDMPPQSLGICEPGEVKAARIVWTDALKMPMELYPEVVWRGPGDCADGLGWNEPSVGGDGGTCVGGAYWTSGNKAVIVARPRISDSSYAHELVHAWQWEEYKAIDYDHTNPVWKTVLPDLQRRLAAAGL